MKTVIHRMPYGITLILACLLVAGFALPAVSAEKLDPIKTVVIGENRDFVVNGKPFFPIMSWAQSPRNFAKLRSININTFCGNHSVTAKQYCNAAQAAGGYAIPGFDKETVGHSFLLAWIHGDEPDMARKKQDSDSGKTSKVPRRSVEQVAAHYQRIKAADRSRPVFVTFTSHFMKEFRGNYDQATKDKIYPNFVKYCDVVGFDTYPIYGWNRPDWLDYPGRGVAQLRAIAGPKKPIYAWIETHKGSKWVTYENQLDVLPCHTRSEVWLAIIRGATAIGYFTHAWRPRETEFAPTEDMQRELRRLNGQITRLAPVILTAPARVDVSITLENALKGDITARKFDGRLYLFTVNYDPRQQGGRATVKIAGLKAGTKIEVVDEGRYLTAGQGSFTDQFESLAVHIYRLKL